MEKKNWFLKHKILSGILLVIVVLTLKSAADAGKTARIEDQQKQTVQETKVIFDIPSLVGKNIDEIIATIGEPDKNSLPTDEQAKITNEWSVEFTKENKILMVEYNLKSKVVKDLFISGDNKDELLTIGNLKENDPNYSLEFVKQQTDPTKITGVVVTKK